MVTQRQYWIVSPNVMKDRSERAVEAWKNEIVRHRVAIIGYKRGTPTERRFRKQVQPSDVVLIARRRQGQPDPVAAGTVKAGLERRQFPDADSKRHVWVRELEGFLELRQVPDGIPLINVLPPKGRALTKLHPDEPGRRGSHHKKVCKWVNQQLGLAGKQGNNYPITKKPLGTDKGEPEPTYDYEVTTKKQARAAQRKESELIDDYERWLQRQGRQLWRLQIGQMECDVWEKERRNLVEAKGTISRQDIRMAVGQLLDYAHQIREDSDDPNKAILLPAKPYLNDLGWVASVNVSVIWRSGRRFQDNAGGQFV